MDALEDARLLAGEADADVRDPRVIERWVTVYSELVRYKERLLPVTSTWAAAISPEAERELDRMLHRLLGERLTQYRRRLVHWQSAAAASA